MPQPPFAKVLVANRGEIARRVFRTCAEHGIATVAVYSTADADAPHVSDADEAYCIGPPTAAESYLRVEAVIDAARRSGADAIHPGYGFLSERPELVAACEAAGITFVGPPVRAMTVMGDKVQARRAMIEAGVPVVPGVEDVPDAQAALAVVDEIGLPAMIKASAGGGGKGMRIVHAREDVVGAFEGAQREAIAAFGDGRVFIERAVMRARHVEIQVMADQHGACVGVGERDCSVQRRHQKVIEEAPCPSRQMTPEVRASMIEVATRVAAAVDYVGAGTVEYLFEETPQGANFFFLEMNTRLQVEHPVTEAVYGHDLVWDQLRVAAGEPLGYTQQDIVPRGHAVECRIYAEDPVSFLPRPGTVTSLRWPEGGIVRVDAAVEEGSEVSSYYDPMVAKLTCWAPDRAAAVARMQTALAQTVILGLQTNIALHQRILAEPDFATGLDVTTRYIEHHPEVLEPPAALDPEAPPSEQAIAVAAAAAVVAAQSSPPAASRDAGPSSSGGAWAQSARWRR